MKDIGKSNLSLKETMALLPPLWDENLLPQIQEEIKQFPTEVFVLDDDPTGAQTVRDVAVLTDWSLDALLREFDTPEKATFVLTNSRSKPVDEACNINRAVGINLLSVSHSKKKPITVISRSDSTLRGHFPEEVDALSEAMGSEYDVLLFIPYFAEGGRYTINNIQYVLEEDTLIPAGDTPYAKDSAFGYKSSDLCEWIEEKTKKDIKATEVATISIDEIRLKGPEFVEQKLKSLPKGSVCVVNAADMADLYVVALGVIRAEKGGRIFLTRSSASFVKARIGQGDYDLLTRSEMSESEVGGALILVGSHVPGSTRQLEEVLKIPSMNGIELKVSEVVDGFDVVSPIVAEADLLLERSKDVTIYTSREVLTGKTPEDYLEIGARVTDAMTDIVRRLTVQPRYIVSKGGMTSSNVTTNGLGMVRSLVPGQILPGVLVLQMGPESKYPDSRLVLFPGNVGGATAIADVIGIMNSPEN